ncbi:uncharacterized protein B0H18DRAFT_1033474 [Fomitopsis serialis]|uniref:uncharacterized protein n=1 Tax=Fomitopsis serialis TaxID=139415 RepID=UPI00200784EB|nr:uncharacterized protein B0H18DRAFT_1033474 [Neoantrodia serialis]KAH9917705.1 hypothetical protein B0H18DRAFT_1033474 [Neoantrodia serialis]
MGCTQTDDSSSSSPSLEDRSDQAIVHSNLTMGVNFTVQALRSASDFLVACAPALIATRSISANFALTTTYALAERPAELDVSAVTEDLWFSARSAGDDDPSDHAGRLASSVDPRTLPTSHIDAAMRQLVQAAEDANVPGTRIFGVIGPKALCEPFASVWGSVYGLRPKLVMDFALAHVTRSTLRRPIRSLAPNVKFDICSPADLDVAAAMCECATHPMDEPVPPPLDAAAARAHAKKLIDGRCLYGARVDGALRSLVSITRETPGVRAVSKAYTDPEVRGQGIAEALVRYALESVCLFFEPSNPSAVRLYRKIGFSITSSGENEEWAEVAWEDY